jgi:hypothetical protein
MFLIFLFELKTIEIFYVPQMNVTESQRIETNKIGAMNVQQGDQIGRIIAKSDIV